jgi:hypothetical protein
MPGVQLNKLFSDKMTTLKDNVKSGRVVIGIMIILLTFFIGCERDDDLVAIVSFEISEPVLTVEGISTGGQLIANRAINYDQIGIVYSTRREPVISDAFVPGHDIETSWIQQQYSIEFQGLVTGLPAGRTYYMRAFITTRTGTAYSRNQVEFTP